MHIECIPNLFRIQSHGSSGISWYAIYRFLGEKSSEASSGSISRGHNVERPSLKGTERFLSIQISLSCHQKLGRSEVERTNKETKKQTNKQTNKQSINQTNNQSSNQTNKQTNKQTSRKTSKQTKLEIIPSRFNTIQKPIPKLQKREKTQDILRFIDATLKNEFFFFPKSMNRKMSCVFSRF